MEQQKSFTRQLLIAIDENPAVHAALKYCGTIFKNDADTGFHLVHCAVSETPPVLSTSTDPDKTLFPTPPAPSSKNSHKYQRLLDSATQALESFGFDSNSIRTSLIPSANQVCQSIAMEADKTLADAIVVARRGIGYIGEMILGSVSASLIRNSPATPLWIVDGSITEKDILIGVDGSVNSLRAVEHVAHVLPKNSDITIYLYHCTAFLAPDVVCTLDNFYEQWDREWCETHLTGDGCLFNGPAQLLQDAGIDPTHIVVLPETKNLEESTSIIAQAKKHKCGTIVIGRRGPSVAKGFFGGVSNRTIRQTQNMAIWVVG